MQDLVSAAQKLSVTVGIYSSTYEWYVACCSERDSRAMPHHRSDAATTTTQATDRRQRARPAEPAVVVCVRISPLQSLVLVRNDLTHTRAHSADDIRSHYDGNPVRA